MAPSVGDENVKKVVIIGGSYGGISIAHYLLRHAIPKLPETPIHQVILISTSAQILCRPACPRALISDEMFPQDKLFASVAKAFENYPQRSIHFLQATATGLDHVHRVLSIQTASGEKQQINFHALVVASGASTFSPLLGINKDADALRANWHAFREALPTAQHIVIGGGGPAGVETAGELGEYLNGRPGWFSSKLENPKVKITLVSAGSRLLPVLRPALAKTAEVCLEKLGVDVLLGTRIKSVEPSNAGADSVTSKALITLDDGRVLNADLYIPATGVKPNTTFIRQELLISDGRVRTNPSTLRVDEAGPRIYAIGDAASYAKPAIHQILNAVPVLGANIKHDLQAAAGLNIAVGEDKIFQEDVRETQMVPIGKSQGVGAAMGFRLPSFLVWLIKGRDYWLWTTGSLWSGKQWAKES